MSSSTDVEWEKWGAWDPYFGVITDARFRSTNLTEEARQQFFVGGRGHANSVLHTCALLYPGFHPHRILDFGCGVGRMVVPFAEGGAEVVGLDVSPSMLAEARRNCDDFGVPGVQLLLSDDTLSRLEGTFDLVHSALVFQHLEVRRGTALFARVVERVAPGGVGALQVTFGKAYHADTYGQLPPPPPPPPPRSALRRFFSRPAPPPADPQPPAPGDPQMQMNPYNLSELMFVLQRSGITNVHLILTNDGGEMGTYIYFRRPAS